MACLGGVPRESCPFFFSCIDIGTQYSSTIGRITGARVENGTFFQRMLGTSRGFGNIAHFGHRESCSCMVFLHPKARNAEFPTECFSLRTAGHTSIRRSPTSDEASCFATRSSPYHSSCAPFTGFGEPQRSGYIEVWILVCPVLVVFIDRQSKPPEVMLQPMCCPVAGFYRDAVLGADRESLS